MSLLLFGLMIIALGLGYIPLSLSEIWQSFSQWGDDSLNAQIVYQVRMPRIVAAVLVGASLSMAGVVFQGILLNPLADPFTLGISSGAAFGAALSFVFSLDIWGIYTIGLCAFTGAVLTLLLVLGLSSPGGKTSPHALILSGVIVSAILSAGISFLKFLASEDVGVIIFWLMGSFVSVDWNQVLALVITMLLALPFFTYYIRDLDLLSLGNRSARSLGVKTKKVRITLLVTASFLSAVSVSMVGIIGFVGLLIPHLMRFVVGPKASLLVPASGLAGGILLLMADTITRTQLPNEVPIGVLTSLIGGPFFCYLFWRRQKDIEGND